MSERGLRTSDYDFHLPPGQIAQSPAERRDASRLLVVNRAAGTLEHRVFGDLVGYVPAGDALVLNETRVFPARLLGRRASGAEAEVLLLTPHGGDEKTWTALVRPGAKLKPGRTVEIADELRVGATVLISVGALEAVGATVKWVGAGAAGLAFARPIDPEKARMRAAIAPKRADGLRPAPTVAPPPKAGWFAELENPYRG